jgi:cytochrome P450
MKIGRRFFLSGFAAILTGTKVLPAGDQGQRPNNPSHVPQFPDASNSNGTEDTPLPPRADPKVQVKEDQKALRRDVDRLVQLTKDLKEESDKTPETDILSLTLVKKAEDIEKLARQIKERIRAS